MAKRKRLKEVFSIESLREEVDREINNSSISESVLGGLKSLNLRHIQSLPPDVLLCAAIVKFGIVVVCEARSIVQSLGVLPAVCRCKVLKEIFPSFDESDLDISFEVVSRSSCSFPVVNAPFRLFAPPVSRCIHCHRDLLLHNKPTKVHFYTMDGHQEALKVSLKCNPCNTLYGYTKFGNQTTGWQLYDSERAAVESTDVCLVDRIVLKWQTALGCHAWVSFSGFAEAFNQVYQPVTEYGEKQTASTFWNRELEEELREIGQLDFFGKMLYDKDREKVMEEVDKIRAKTVYEHTPQDCSDACKERGCGRLWVVDGQWKLMFAHCMMQRKNSIKGFPFLNYPNVCTASPQHGKAFCEEHVTFLRKTHPEIPTDLRGFLKYCGVQQSDTETSGEERQDLQKSDVSRIDNVLSSLDREVASTLGESAVNSQGNADFIEREQNAVNSLLDERIEQQPTTCNKDTGEKQRMQKWSRGHLFIVRGGGIIDKWSPLFKSESPSQVFIIVLLWLFKILKPMNPANWSKVFVAHDNMCHLDGLKAAKKTLPWPSPWDKAWMSINKIIDRLHIKNHKDKKCKEVYNPESLKGELPSANTMAAEQTFCVAFKIQEKDVCDAQGTPLVLPSPYGETTQ